MLRLFILATDSAIPPPLSFDPSTLLPAVSTVGSLGFAVWYAYYTTTAVIPKLLEAHRAERLEMQTRFDAQIEQLLAEMKEQRNEFIAWRTAGATRAKVD
ncbi:MAG: hypothetical protein JSS49_29790 [Planctomycetes bacterium]|nr:hypothetical protein [Planctomycetota bacterium]